MSEKAKQQARWTVDDAVALRNFISTNPKFLAHLEQRKPPQSDESYEKAATTGLKRSGFEMALDAIRILQQDPVSSATSESDNI